jgi:alpha-tubulin suppressor-like RCC1 family protein
LADKTVTCWGQNGFGQLGRGNFVNGGPEKVLNLSNVKQVSMGDGHACALKEDNSIVCWGDNYAKQFQNSSLKYSNVPVPSYLIADVIRIIARNSITYFLTNSGRIIRTRTGLEIEDKTVDSLFNLRYTINSAVKGIGIKKAQGKVVISWRNSNSEFTTPTEFYWRIKKRNTSKWDKWKKSKEESPAKVILPLAKGKYDFQIRSNMNVFSLTSKVFKFRIL